MGQRITASATKRLWARSGGECYHPDCTEDLIRDDEENWESYHIGEQAHIHPHSENGGPRSGGDMPMERRKKVENFILLCPTHHREIDKAPDGKYPIERLFEWKYEHEKEIRKAIQSRIPNINHAQLNVVVNHLLDSNITYNSDNKLTKISDKIKKNGFSKNIKPIIKTGLTQSKTVEKFLNDMQGINPNFVDRLASHFVEAYQHVSEQDLSPDDAFDEMLYVACHNSHHRKYHAAGAAVVVYFFEKCDIFKK